MTIFEHLAVTPAMVQFPKRLLKIGLALVVISPIRKNGRFGNLINRMAEICENTTGRKDRTDILKKEIK